MHPRILYIGPLKDFSGYATAARDYVRALDHVGANLVTRSVRYDGGDYQSTPREEELANAPLQNIDIVLQHTTPNEQTKKEGLFNVSYFAWETDKVPAEWAKQINKMDLALMPCDTNIKAARLGGITIPIVKVPHTFSLDRYKKVGGYDIPGCEDKFKILAVCQLSKKKGVDALLQAYLSEFRKHEDVVLVLKIYFAANDTEEQKRAVLDEIQKQKEALRIGNYAQIYVIHGVMSEDAMTKLYNTADAYCLPSRGEGWGIPAFDAMGHGVPPIVTGWGGPTEFVDNKCGWLVNYHMAPCFDMPHPHSFMYTGLDNWAEPNMDSLKASLRSAYIEWATDTSENTPWKARKAACLEKVKSFTYDKVGAAMYDAILHHYKMWRIK